MKTTIDTHKQPRLRHCSKGESGTYMEKDKVKLISDKEFKLLEQASKYEDEIDDFIKSL